MCWDCEGVRDDDRSDSGLFFSRGWPSVVVFVVVLWGEILRLVDADDMDGDESLQCCCCCWVTTSSRVHMQGSSSGGLRLVVVVVRTGPTGIKEEESSSSKRMGSMESKNNFPSLWCSVVVLQGLDF